ncbi:MAG TPA: hypothetical protein VKE50_09095 [Thermoanaerobaculia bacterium]|nr:hypothetical protein [Thermoanaerobaculia bacterium]
MSAGGLARRRTLSVVLAAALASRLVTPEAAAAILPQAQSAERSSLLIRHDPLVCVTTELAPLVDAQVEPGPQLDRGYVYFKAAGTEDFYYTVMRGPAEGLEAALPRPLPETKAIDYKLRARDVAALVSEKGEYVPPVVPGRACKAKAMAVPDSGANLTVGLTREGQNPVPPGFNKKDIGFIILFSGATVTLAQALGGSAGGASTSATGATTGPQGTTAKSGGASKGVWIAAGVAVAAGAGLAIANNTGGGGSKPSATPTFTATPTATPSPTLTPTAPAQFVEADVSWSGPGDVDIRILNSSGQSVGTVVPAGCESTAPRTEHVLLPGAPAGSYSVVLSAKTCGTGTPPTIAAVMSVQSSGQPKCPNTFVDVPVGGTIPGCTFTLP